MYTESMSRNNELMFTSGWSFMPQTLHNDIEVELTGVSDSLSDSLWGKGEESKGTSLNLIQQNPHNCGCYYKRHVRFLHLDSE